MKDANLVAMIQKRHYSRAPITEALIDIRVLAADSITLQDLQKLSTMLESNYPQRQDMFMGQVEIGPSSDGTATTVHIGYIFRELNGRHVVQARLDGFTFSRLAPYESWTPFRDEAKRVWEIYRSVVKPKVVTRVAVRYINRLDLPLPIMELTDYIVNSPDVPPGIPFGALSGFFMQLQIPQPDIDSMLVINQVLPTTREEDSDSSEQVSVILDFDLFREGNLNPSEDQIWEHLERLHERKNMAFEASITDSTRRLIE